MRRYVLIASILIIAGGAFAWYLRYADRPPGGSPHFDEIPYARDGYTGQERRFADYSYDILQADTTTLRLYVSPEGDAYWMFVGYFQSQKYGSQIHSPRHCLPGSGWKIERLEPYRLPLPDGGHKTVNRLIIRDREQKQLMLYWFETRSGTIRSEFALKWNLMVNSLLLRPTDVAFVRVNLPIGSDETIDNTADRAVRYLQTFYLDLERALPFAG
ncbi:MAG TPA: EpsI family protein [Acidobacteriota bacterium]|nr:EpsI family protein [Acidobacteriota bacterium]